MIPKPITRNTLFYGDNLPILREHIADESVDLVYLDPPFNSNRSYNVLFKDESGKAAEAQITAFDDTWHWSGSTPATYHELVTEGPSQVAGMIAALYQAIGPNQMMAYLVMMAARLIELHRVLKPTGSLYLHCDPTASHYLKIIQDAIFGPDKFINEIVWKRTTAHGDSRQGSRHFGRVTDTILFYAKGSSYTWNQLFIDYDEKYVANKYRSEEPGTGRRYMLDNLTGPGGAAKGNPQFEFLGVTRYWRYSKENMERLHQEGRIVQPSPGAVPRYKRYLDEMKGQPIQNAWLDIDPINSQAAERLGYPTQKPLALLERIIQASSNPGDVVLDPFCGCGTTVAAAQKLGRRWIGIDITHLSIALQKYRLREMFPDAEFDVLGEPRDMGSACQLAQDDRFQFQWWALSLIRARPVGGEAGSKRGKKGADQGIDGVITFIDDASGKPKRVIVQVKSGGVSSQTLRDLRGTVEREQAAIGVLITLEPATKPMEIEAGSAGFYESPAWQQKYPRLQILTIEQLLAGAHVKMPPAYGTFKQAQKVKQNVGVQGGLDLGV
jgi:site-specific DNA-methyltransferase (adenine-specific)